jgi:YgiT-type zinc finger domain-containing protein
MDKEGTGKSWRGVSEEIIVGMTEWRQQNPKASFEEIEGELDRRLSVLRARMLADLAIASASTEWKIGPEAPKCPNCGAALQPNGKKKRKLQTRGGRGVELEREYGVCPQCGQGIFPPR